MKKIVALLLSLCLCLGIALAEEKPASIRRDVALADFSGQWMAALAELSGMLLPAEEVGMQITLSIRGGWATVAEGEGEAAYTTQWMAEMQGNALVLTYQQAGESLIRRLYLHEDGMLSMADESRTVLYFERIEP